MEYMIPIELAEMANKIGFNEDTKFLYNKKNSEITNKWVPDNLKCPTINELNSWIRQKHNINICVRIFGDKWASYVEEVPTGIEITPRLVGLSEYDTFEEALCNALLEVMNSIFKEYSHDYNEQI